MKINEYNEMMRWLTKPGKVLGNNINNKKISNTDERTALKRGGSDTKVASKNSKMLQYINDHNIVYGDKKATNEEAEAAAKRIEARPKEMSYQDEYKLLYGKEPKKVAKAPKPTPNGQTTLTSDDWNLIIDSTDFPYELFDDSWTKKRVQVEENLFEEYLRLLKAGELEPNTSFEMFEKNYLDFDTDVISKINKKVLEKKKAEGLAALLGVSPGKRI